MDKVSIGGVELTFHELELGEIEESKDLPGYICTYTPNTIESEISCTATFKIIPGHKRFKKWFNGPRKTKKKNYGLSKDRRRIGRKIMRGQSVTMRELDRIKMQVVFN